LRDGAIVLRQPREDDASGIAVAAADPEVALWTRIPSPYTKDDAFAWIALAGAALREGSAYHLLVTDAEGKGPLGSVGLEVRKRPEPHGELGYWMAAEARGRGIATRAVRLLADWGRDVLGLPVLEIHVLPENEPSRAVARKAGFQLTGLRAIEFKGRVQEFEIYVRSE
jgi:RimJ/RimL family protein N-acetyltransferase